MYVHISVLHLHNLKERNSATNVEIHWEVLFMYVETIEHTSARRAFGRIVTSVCGSLLLILVPLLTSCGGPAPLEYTPIYLAIPAHGLNSPVGEPLPASSKLLV